MLLQRDAYARSCHSDDIPYRNLKTLADSRQRPRRRVKPWPGGNLKQKGDVVKEESPNYNERAILKRRGLNPADYTVEKRLNYALILRNRYTEMLKIVDKRSN